MFIATVVKLLYPLTTFYWKNSQRFCTMTFKNYSNVGSVCINWFILESKLRFSSSNPLFFLLRAAKQERKQKDKKERKLLRTCCVIIIVGRRINSKPVPYKDLIKRTGEYFLNRWKLWEAARSFSKQLTKVGYKEVTLLQNIIHDLYGRLPYFCYVLSKCKIS